MTSSPRPYKSRLFNFLNRQRIVLGDRLAKTFRSAKVTAIWGTQILVYPAYLIAQTGRAFVWKLEQKVAPIPLPETRNTSQEDYIPADTPVWKTLNSVQSLLDTIPGNYEIHAFAPPVLWTANLPAIAPATDPKGQTITKGKIQRIRGIASTLDEHHLVLATVENKSLDLLTKKQRVHLEQTIRRELADYAYRQYLQRIKARQYLIPPSLTVNPNIAPPLRWFWQLMRWEQQGNIAQAIDLFQEAKIVPQWQEMDSQEPNGSAIAIAPSREIWRPPLLVADLVVELDEAIATLESKQNHLRDRLEIWWQELENSDLNDRDRLTKMQHFLRAAMDYFFGFDRRTPSLPAESSSVEQDPWLVWEELYDRSRGKFTSHVPRQAAIADGEIQELYDRSQALELQSQPANSHSSLLKKSDSMSSSPDPSSESNDLATVQNKLAQKPENKPELDDNWLEVDAKTTGYIEHPLEKALKFVDVMMAWVENAIVAVWNFLKRNF